MNLHIPGTNINIGQSKQAKDKKAALKNAYKNILSKAGPDDGAKVTWPEMAEGAPQWYGNEGASLRHSTAAGLMREAESKLKHTPNYKLQFNVKDPTGNPSPVAFSSSAGLVNLPTGDNYKDIGEGYFSKPQYLASVIAHEVAHNSDRLRNSPTVPHNIETFRPLEKAASKAAGLEPQYNPGTDVGIGGANEYADRYKSLGQYDPHYYIGQNPQDLTRSPKLTKKEALGLALAAQRANFASGQARGGTLPGSPRAASLL